MNEGMSWPNGRQSAAMVAITLVSGLLLIMAGIISSALEVFFIIATTILVQRLYTLSSCIFSR